MYNWPQRISAKYLANMARCFRVEDIVYMPTSQGNIYERISAAEIAETIKKLSVEIKPLGKALPRAKKLLKKINLLKDWGTPWSIWQEVVDEAKCLLSYAGYFIRENYIDILEYQYLGQGAEFVQEPQWIELLPDPLKADLRSYAMMMGAQGEISMVIPDLPYSGIGYVILDDGLVETAGNALGLWRLQMIAQLSNLTDPVVNEQGIGTYARKFEHSRLVHSLDTYAIINLILHNNREKINPTDLNSWKIAALIHDIATPAGGDGTKPINPQAFCEEKNIKSYLRSKDWNRVQNFVDVSLPSVIDAINGRGLGGKLLDVADKIAYISRDLKMYLGRYVPNSYFPWPINYLEIKRLADTNPGICTLWDSVQIVDNDVVFLDGELLGKFLKLRAMMFRNLYYNPYARAYESLLAHTILSCLYEKGEICPEEFFEMTDWDLERMIERFTGIFMVMNRAFSLGEPHAEVFTNLEGALRRERELIHQGEVFVVIEDTRGKIKPATNLLVISRESGKLEPFYKAFPHESEEIENICHVNKPIFLHCLKNLKISEKSQAELKEYNLQRIKRSKTPQ